MGESVIPSGDSALFERKHRRNNTNKKVIFKEYSIKRNCPKSENEIDWKIKMIRGKR